jgi:WD40 repeat protein
VKVVTGKRRRRWYQYRLRTLLVLVPLMSMPLGCDQSPADIGTLAANDLGVNVAEFATLSQPSGVGVTSLESIVFSQDGKELAVTRLEAVPRPDYESSSGYPWNRRSVLETFSVGTFRGAGSVSSGERPHLFYATPAPRSAPTSMDHSAFILVEWAFYAPTSIAVRSGTSRKVIEVLDYEPKFPFTHEPRFPLNGVAVSPNSQTVAVAVGGDHDQSWDTPWHGEVILWDFASGEEGLRFHSPDVAYFGVAFSPDGRLLAAAGGTYVGVRNGREVYRGELRCWEVATGRLLFETEAPTSLRCIAFSPDGSTVAAGGVLGTVRYYQIPNGTEDDLFQCVPVGGSSVVLVDAVAFSPDGGLLAAGVGCYNKDAMWGELRLLDRANNREATVGFRRHSAPVTCVVFSPDGEWLAAGTYDGYARAFSVRPIQKTPGP